MKATDKVYEKSNKIVSVDYVRFSHKEYKSLLEKCGEYDTDRFYYGQNLLNYLCEKYGIPRCRLIVRSRPQPTFKGGSAKKLGCYHPGMSGFIERDGHYVYFSYDNSCNAGGRAYANLRGRGPFLCRTAANEKDYRGGYNNTIPFTEAEETFNRLLNAMHLAA